MAYYTFSWIDWVLLLSLVTGTVIAWFINRRKSNQITKSGQIMLLTIAIVACFGILFWDVFPLAVCFKIITLSYWLVALHALSTKGKEAFTSAMYSPFSAFYQLSKILKKDS